MHYDLVNEARTARIPTRLRHEARHDPSRFRPHAVQRNAPKAIRQTPNAVRQRLKRSPGTATQIFGDKSHSPPATPFAPTTQARPASSRPAPSPRTPLGRHISPRDASARSARRRPGRRGDIREFRRPGVSSRNGRCSGPQVSRPRSPKAEHRPSTARVPPTTDHDRTTSRQPAQGRREHGRLRALVATRFRAALRPCAGLGDRVGGKRAPEPRRRARGRLTSLRARARRRPTSGPPTRPETQLAGRGTHGQSP
jgi:hypothetical protein